MTSAFRSINSSLGQIATGVSAAPAASPPPTGTGGGSGGGSGGGFSFSPDEIRAIVTDWKNLAVEYDRSSNNAVQLTTVEGPGQELASASHASNASYSGALYRQSLLEKREYCLSQAQKFQDALHDYLGIERESVRKIFEAGESGGALPQATGSETI